MSADLLALIGKSQREAERRAAESKSALKGTLDRIADAEQASGMTLCPPGSAQPADKPEVGTVGLFKAEFAARVADRKAAAAMTLAVETLSVALEDCRATETQCRAELDAAHADLSEALASAARHKNAVCQSVSKERAAIDDKGESFYQGCACGLALGCLGLAGYIVLTVVMICLGRPATGGSPFGVVFMTLFVAPIGVSALLQILYGLKRMMVESELNAKLRAADEYCEKVVEMAKGAHSGVQPGLEQKLRDAEAAAQSAQSALDNLLGPKDPAPAPEMPSRLSAPGSVVPS